MSAVVQPLVVLLAVAALTIAQAQTTGSISGVVRDEASGGPLADVHIWCPGHDAVTDNGGRFLLEDVPPGTIRVLALSTPLAARAATSVRVRSGEEATVEFRLQPGGSISGRVVDSQRGPVAGAIVMLLRRSYRYRELVYSKEKAVATDGLGEYRFDSVVAEQGFLILAKMPLKADSAPDLPSLDHRGRTLAPTFYGNASDVGGAQIVKLTSGERRERMDIRFAETPAYCIEGSVHGVSGLAFVSLTDISRSIRVGS